MAKKTIAIKEDDGTVDEVVVNTDAIEPITDLFGNGDMNTLRDKINEINNICINKKIEECFVVNYAIIYDGRREIYYCMKEYFSKNNNDTKYENMNNIMWLKNDIHLVIRTGGTHRMSSFFPWQSIYAEWYFLDKYWPEITEEDIYNIMNDYSCKIINYGS